MSWTLRYKMRPKAYALGMASVPFILLTLAVSCTARPRSHTHHHSGRLPRATRSSVASSSSSFVANPSAGLCSKFPGGFDVQKAADYPIRPKQPSGPCLGWNSSG